MRPPKTRKPDAADLVFRDGSIVLHGIDARRNRYEAELAVLGRDPYCWATMGSESTLQTPRLSLRRWRPSDEAEMARINRDPEVTRYLNRPVDEEAVAGFYEGCVEHWEKHGFGFFAVESREEATRGRFIGFVGVDYPTFLTTLAQRPELGWRLERASWGRGLATEAAVAAREDAFGRLELNELISIIHPENGASTRVATKVGMKVEGEVYNPVLDRAVDVWQLTAPAAS